MKQSDKKGVLHYVRAREMGFCASMPRSDYRLFTALVMSENRVYRKKVEYHCSNPIFFEATLETLFDCPLESLPVLMSSQPAAVRFLCSSHFFIDFRDRVYANHYRRAYSVVKWNLIYDLGQSLFQTTPRERITDADIFYLTSASEPASILCSEMFVGLTDLHRLLLLDATTGKFLKAFQLPLKDRGYKFSEIGIGRDNETLYVKGRCLRLSPASRQPDFVFAIFNLAPFRFQCMFLLSETVIGPFVNVMISQDLLIFVHNGSLLKFYSLEDVLYQSQSDVGPDEVLQVNASIDWPCPCLYEVRVTSDVLEMGGYPWHCLYKPPKQLAYRLQAVATDTVVRLENDQLKQTDPGQGMEVNVFFNPDESGSIIHVAEREIKKMLITDADGGAGPGSSRLKEVWSLAVTKPLTEEEDTIYTASGRKASRSSWMCNDDLEYIHCVHYSSSMDAFCVVVYYETPTSDPDFESASKRSRTVAGMGKVLIVDNQYGRLKKTINLDEPWDNTAKNGVAWDCFRVAVSCGRNHEKDSSGHQAGVTTGLACLREQAFICECEEHHIELDDDVLIHTIKHRTGKHSCHVYRLMEALDSEPAGDSTSRKKPPRRQLETRSRKRRRADTDSDEGGDLDIETSRTGRAIVDHRYNFRARDR